MRRKQKIAVIAALMLAAVCIAGVLLFFHLKAEKDREFSGVLLPGTNTLSIIYSGAFTVTNGAGQQMYWNGGDPTGDMEYSFVTCWGQDPAYGEYEVTNSSAYAYEPEGTKFWFSFEEPYSKQSSYVISGENLTRMTYTSEYGTTLEGENLTYHFSYASSDVMIFLNGSEEDQVRFYWEDGKLYAEGVQGSVSGSLDYLGVHPDAHIFFKGDAVIDPQNWDDPVTSR